MRSLGRGERGKVAGHVTPMCAAASGDGASHCWRVTGPLGQARSGTPDPPQRAVARLQSQKGAAAARMFGDGLAVVGRGARRLRGGWAGQPLC